VRIRIDVAYDGTEFSGWARQPGLRTVQGELEAALATVLRIAEARVTCSGRTDAGVHARGQAAGVRVDERWTADRLRKAMNALLPDDVWVAAAHEMAPRFHARYDATARRYAYHVGTDDAAHSPFRRTREWPVVRPLDRGRLDDAAAALVGEHAFHGFAVKGTAPADDHHRCTIHEARWRARDGGLAFDVEANRFLHHIVRFLVGTMIDIGLGRRPPEDLPRLLAAGDNSEVSAPAPAHALFLDAVRYPADLYLTRA